MHVSIIPQNIPLGKKNVHSKLREMKAKIKQVIPDRDRDPKLPLPGKRLSSSAPTSMSEISSN